MKTLLTAIALLISTLSFSQEVLTFPVVSAALFQWKEVEKQMPKPIIDKFIKDTPKEFQAYKRKDAEVAFLNLDSLRKVLHFLDLNGDGKEDVIFEGQSDGEANEVAIFIKTRQGYKKVFSTFQGVVKMEWENKALSRLYIDDWGCCDDYIERHMIYDVSYRQVGIPKFTKVYQALSIHNGIKPDSLLEKKFAFEVLNEGYKMRSAPKIDDVSVQPWDNDQTKETGSGNIIGRLLKGATGTALAKKLDNTGREWLFVQIDAAYFTKNDIFYVENKFPTKYIGWISSRFIKAL
jgi:hypothetical protein